MNCLTIPPLPSSREERNSHLSKGDGLRQFSHRYFTGLVTADDLCAWDTPQTPTIHLFLAMLCAVVHAFNTQLTTVFVQNSSCESSRRKILIARKKLKVLKINLVSREKGQQDLWFSPSIAACSRAWNRICQQLLCELQISVEVFSSYWIPCHCCNLPQSFSCLFMALKISWWVFCWNAHVMRFYQLFSVPCSSDEENATL